MCTGKPKDDVGSFFMGNRPESVSNEEVAKRAKRIADKLTEGM
jgi:hypothetical protein